MNKSIQLIFFGILLTYGFWSGDWQYAKWVPLSVFGTTCALIPIWKISRLAAVVLWYSILNGLFDALSEVSKYRALKDLDQEILKVESLKAVVFLLCIVAIVSNFDNIKAIGKYLWAACILTSVVNIVSFALGGWFVMVGPYKYNPEITVVGLSFNKSLSSTLVALLFPFVLERFPPRKSWQPFAIWALPIGAIIYLQSAISIFAVAAALAAYALAKARPSGKELIKALAASSAIVIGVLGVAYIKFGSDLWNFSSRIPVWKGAVKLQFENLDKIPFGFGLGTFHAYGIAVTKTNGIKTDNVFTLLHNDWLQCLWDLGVVGFLLWATLFCWSAIKAFDRPWLFAAFASIGVCSFGNFIHHMALEAFIVAFVYAFTWNNKFDLTK